MTHTSTALKRHLLVPAVLTLSMLLSVTVLAQEAATPAQDSSTSEPVESEVNLKEVVKFNWGFQGATQGASTPNQAGLGFFLPMMVSDNGVSFLDVLANTFCKAALNLRQNALTVSLPADLIDSALFLTYKINDLKKRTHHEVPLQR